MAAERRAAAKRSARDFVAAHRSDEATELWGITELCREFGITLRALRFYEDKGLISPARDGMNRVYSYKDRARLQLILRGMFGTALPALQ